MVRNPNRPLILELDETELPEAPEPADAPPPDDPLPNATQKALIMTARRPRSGLLGLALALLGGLLTLIAGVALSNFIAQLFVGNPALGWIGLVLLVALLVVLAVICLREIVALARLGRVEKLRRQAVAAHGSGSANATAAVLGGLDALYHRRPELTEPCRKLREAEGDMPDTAARLAYAERLLMTPLDKEAEIAVMRAARDVATATAIIPLALADVAIALTRNLRMVREIAEIYGGRAGWIESWRLMRAVAAHLVATGAVAIADDILGPILGGGMLERLSRRFGEGALNGALTARVGIAAMDVCRPLPFAASPRPNASALLLRALKSWRRAAKPATPPR